MAVHALIIGLGGTGGRVVVRLKSLLADLPDQARDRFRLLAIDTDEEDLRALEHLGCALDDRERLPVTVHVGSLRRHAHLHPYLRRFPLDRLPAIALREGARQYRPLGALALAWNFEAVRERVHGILWSLKDRKRQGEEADFRLAVAVVTSLAGGTGSGMFLDLAYLIRQELRDIGEGDAPLSLIAIGPGAFHDVQGGRILPNTMAALKELHFWARHGRFEQAYRGSSGPTWVQVDASPFDVFYYVDAVDEGGWTWPNREALADMVAEALLVLMADPTGQRVRSSADNILDRLSESTAGGELTFLSSLGVASLEFPVRQIIEALAARRGAEQLGSLLRPPDASLREEADRWRSERPWSPERLQSALRRRATEGTPLVVALEASWLFDEDPEAMPGAALRYIDQYRQLRIDGEFADHVRRQAQDWLERAAQDLEEPLSRMVEAHGLPAAIDFVQTLQEQVGALEAALDEQRARTEAEEQAARNSLAAPPPPWGVRLLAWIPGLGRWLRRRWARRVVRRILEAGERFLNARLNRIVLEEARAAVGRLADLLGRHQMELQDLERAVRGAVALLEGEAEELSRRILAEDKPPPLRLVGREQLDGWAGQGPPASKPGLSDLRRLREPEAFAADAKRRFRPGLEFLRTISVEDLLRRPDGIPPSDRLEALKRLARPAWRLDEAACPSKPALLQMIGVRDANQTLFAGEGNRLVSTGDPYRVTVVAMRVGAPISGLQSYETLRRAYEASDKALVHVFQEAMEASGG